MRINQFIAQELGVTRGSVDSLIRQTKVEINNQTAKLGDKVMEGDEVVVIVNSKKKVLQYVLPKRILVYKPPFCFVDRKGESKLSHLSKHNNSKSTIYSLIPSRFSQYIALGSLDYMTEGVQILRKPDDESISSTLQKTLHNQSEEYCLITGTNDIQRLTEYSLILKKCKGYMSHQIISSEDMQHLDWFLPSTMAIITITKSRTRNSLYRELELLGIPIQRLIRYRDGDIVATPQLLKQNYIPVN